MTDLVEIEQQLLQAIRSSLTELTGIWDYIGFDAVERQSRCRQLELRVQTTLSEVLREENAFRLELETKIEEKRRQLAEVCHTLGVPPFFPERGLSSTQLFQALQEKTLEYERVKDERISTYKELQQRITRLCQLLEEVSPTYVERLSKFPLLTDEDRIPDEATLKQLRTWKEELDARYLPSLSKHNSLREDIVRIAGDIHYHPEDEMEEELLRVSGLQHLCDRPRSSSQHGVVQKASEAVNGELDEHAKESKIDTDLPYEPVVSEEKLKELAAWRLRLVKEKARLVGTCDELRTHLVGMWHRLNVQNSEQEAFLQKHVGYQPNVLDALQEEVDRCQQLKWENLTTYLQRLHTEASELARSCCLDEKELIKMVGADNGDREALVNKLETTVEELNERYQQNRPIYESIACYEKAWQSLQEIELRLKDPAIFSNRGGILLKTEKEKKRVLKDLQKLEQEAQDAVNAYDLKSGTGSPRFLLPSGKTFAEHVASRWSDYKARDNSRSRRSVQSATRTGTSTPTGQQGVTN